MRDPGMVQARKALVGALAVLAVVATVGIGVTGCEQGGGDDGLDFEQHGRAVLLGDLNYGCSTQGTEGISTQLLAEIQCLTDGAFLPVNHANVVPTHSRVHLFFAEPTKNALETAAGNSPAQILVTSGFRTLAEQYALWNSGACGLAAQPGSSAHESGRAVDVSNWDNVAVRNALTGAGFSWPYPTNDPVHFSGPGNNMNYWSILSFQRLWNANNPGDLIDEDGAVGPQTLGRLEQTPGEGFAIGQVCESVPDLYLDLEIDTIDGQERDVCTLGGSEGLFDAYQGQEVVQRLLVTNEGEGVAREVWIEIEVDDPAWQVGYWEVFDNWVTNTCGEEFCPNDVNDHANNPAHENPGSAFGLYLGVLSPEETKMTVLTMTASAATFGAGDTAEVRFWVSAIQDYYSKSEYDGAFDNTDDSQTFNGGDLRRGSAASILLREEVCGNGADDDCDGVVDQGCPVVDGDAGVGSDASAVGVDAGGDPDDDPGGGRSGCSCGVGSSGGGVGFLLLLIVVGWIRRRRLG